MRTIYKYPLGDDKTSKIMMPVGAEVLTVGEQFGEAFLWAIVNTENVINERTFESILTGGELPENIGKYHFIGTYFLSGGNYVVHVFEPRKW